jgi:hypothetical protein
MMGLYFSAFLRTHLLSPNIGLAWNTTARLCHVGLEPIISSRAQLVSIFINLKGVLMVELGSIEAEIIPFCKK